jgi:DNA-binding NarL/FixJ family response regulator
VAGLVVACGRAWVCVAVVVAALVAAVALAVGQRGLRIDAPVPDPADWFVSVQISSVCARLGTLVFVAQRRDLWWSKLAFLALTDREPEVLTLVADGFDHRTIGKSLDLSAKSVANHASTS